MLPYPAPDGWIPDAQYFSTPVIWGAGGVALAVGIASAALTATGSIVWGVVLAILFDLLALFAAAAGLFAVTRRPPQLINAVTLGRASVRPFDDWVHFCRERPVRLWARMWLMLSGLGTGVLLALAMPSVLSAPGGVWWLFLFVPVLLPCVVLVAYGLMQLVLDLKNSSFGRIPVGLALGRHGVSRYLVAGGLNWVPWEDVRSVEALPHSRVRIARRGRAESLEFGAGVLEQDAVLVYCAVRFYADHAELRHELSTTAAQQRFEAWDRAVRTGIEDPLPAAP